MLMNFDDARKPFENVLSSVQSPCEFPCSMGISMLIPMIFSWVFPCLKLKKLILVYKKSGLQ